MKPDIYWKHIAADIRRYRKDQITREDLTRSYPDLQITQTNGRWTAIKDAANIVIPADCPLIYLAKIAFATVGEPFDTNQVSFDVVVSYQPEWENLTQKGLLPDICKKKEPLVFDSWVEIYNAVDEPYVDIRYLLKYGSYGDEDGYDVSPDTWLAAKLRRNGTWYEPWCVLD